MRKILNVRKILIILSVIATVAMYSTLSCTKKPEVAPADSDVFDVLDALVVLSDAVSEATDVSLAVDASPDTSDVTEK